MRSRYSRLVRTKLPSTGLLTVLGRIGRRTLIMTVPKTHPRKCAGMVTNSRAGLTRPMWDKRKGILSLCWDLQEKEWFPFVINHSLGRLNSCRYRSSFVWVGVTHWQYNTSPRRLSVSRFVSIGNISFTRGKYVPRIWRDTAWMRVQLLTWGEIVIGEEYLPVWSTGRRKRLRKEYTALDR